MDQKTSSLVQKRRTEAAQRALKEAQDRRQLEKHTPKPKEINGRQGPEPTRFGDWEKQGIISDF